MDVDRAGAGQMGEAINDARQLLLRLQSSSLRLIGNADQMAAAVQELTLGMARLAAAADQLAACAAAMAAAAREMRGSTA